MQAVIADNISKSFGKVMAVDGVSFTLAPGEILGLIGPNGAGKTTTIRMVLDIFKPDSGSIRVYDQLMNEEMKNQVGYLPEERGLYQDISLERCLRYLASIKGMQPEMIEERLEKYLEQFELQDCRKKKVKELSKGMQQKAQIIATFIHQPKLVISTHQMNQAEELCDRILLVNKGKVMLQGTLNEIRRQFARPEILVRCNLPIPSGIRGIAAVKAENNHSRLTLQPGSSTQDVLSELIKRGLEVEQFEIAEPSLDEIFIEVVTGREPNL